MDRRYASRVARALGVVFVVLGFVAPPDVVSKTVVACATVDDPAFRGLSGLTVVWYDGCNEWFVSAFAAVGVLLLIGSALVWAAGRLGSGTGHGDVDAADEWP